MHKPAPLFNTPKHKPTHCGGGGGGCGGSGGLAGAGTGGASLQPAVEPGLMHHVFRRLADQDANIKRLQDQWAVREAALQEANAKLADEVHELQRQLEARDAPQQSRVEQQLSQVQLQLAQMAAEREADRRRGSGSGSGRRSSRSHRRSRSSRRGGSVSADDSASSDSSSPSSTGSTPEGAPRKSRASPPPISTPAAATQSDPTLQHDADAAARSSSTSSSSSSGPRRRKMSRIDCGIGGGGTPLGGSWCAPTTPNTTLPAQLAPATQPPAPSVASLDLFGDAGPLDVFFEAADASAGSPAAAASSPSSGRFAAAAASAPQSFAPLPGLGRHDVRDSGSSRKRAYGPADDERRDYWLGEGAREETYMRHMQQRNYV